MSAPARTTKTADHPRNIGRESTLDVVQAVLELLEALPDRPDRLRVRTGDVDVDLDWRQPSASPTTIASPPDMPRGLPVEDPPSELHFVCSPSVGTFYRAPEPGASPFVAVGAIVKPGRQLGIVEAMKLMLPIEADRPGRIVDVLIEDGQAVEFGQRLLTLAPVDAD